MSGTRTFFFSDFCLQVVGVNIDKILLFCTLALPAAETAAAQTAAARENGAAHHKTLNTEGGNFKQLQMNFLTCCPRRLCFVPYLEPALGHEEVIFHPLFPKLLCKWEPHRSIFIVDFPFVLVTEDGVGIVDFFKLFSSFQVVWILVRMMPQSQFSADK